MRTNDQVQDQLDKALQANLSVLLEGSHGVGKTSLARSAAAKQGLRLKYFSAATLDPFADLVGIPVPVLDGEVRRIVYLRPEDIHQAQILFFDELNRAHPKVLNAVFEIVQFKSINGERLPHLRAVIGAINPAGAGYQVQDLDPALLDKFEIHIQVRFGPSQEWFVQRFGERLGSALVAWHATDLDDGQRQGVTNRRLEFIGTAIESGIDPKAALPPGVSAPVHLLQARLREDDALVTIEQLVNQPEKYATVVAKDLNVAMRFGQLLPMMNPSQKNTVRDLVLALPSEVLARLKAQTPFVFKKTREAVVRCGNPEDARAFEELLAERLRQITP